MAVATDGPEQWPLGDTGMRQPVLQRSDWAMTATGKRNTNLPANAELVGLRPANGNDDALLHLLDIGHIESNKF